MADPYASFSSPIGKQADPYEGIAMPATAGGVQDFVPTVSDPTVMERINRGVNWLGTRATKTLTGMAGVPRALADLAYEGANAVVGPTVARAIVTSNPLTGAAQFMPSTQDMNDVVFNQFGVPDVSSKSRGGKVLDTATEAALGTVLMPGSIARNVLPAAVGGASQEVAGQLTEGTRFEPAARVAGGVVGGLVAAGAQNAAGNALQGVRNLAPNVDQTAAKIVGRGLERDRMTGESLAQRQAELGEGATLVEAGGPNVRGAFRGAIAAPGTARTTAQDAFDTRIEGSNVRTTTALDKGISPNDSLAATVDDLAQGRTAAAGPAYEAAGIPRDRANLKNADRLLMSDDLLTLFNDSPDVQAALRNARRVPELRNEPTNSMAVLDRVYKHLGGLEEQARRAGNNTRAADLGDIRQRLAAGIDFEKPQYGEARAAFSEPSKLIDATNRGREWFTKNVDPKAAAKEYGTMSADEQQSALIGIRDWARTVIGRSDRGTAAERVWNGGDNRARLEAILGPDGFSQLTKTIEGERNLIRTARDTNVGSRTTPMALEAADNAMQSTGVVGNLLQGRFVNAVSNLVGGVVDRVGQGRTEAVNNQIAKILTSSDPQTIKAMTELLERARVDEIARRSGRMNALTIGGGVAPTVNALGGDR